MPNLRLKTHPVFPVKRGRKIQFEFDNRPCWAFEGETVGAALHANGVKIFSRSVKYHRPRGLLCLTGECPNCSVNIDGYPHYAACITPVEDTMDVSSQNCWPSASLDAMSVIDRLGFLLPMGFQYRYFTRSRRAYNVWEGVLRRGSGVGEVHAKDQEQERFRKRSINTDILVVGGGTAGISAAKVAAEAGAKVTLLEERFTLGGFLSNETDFVQRGKETPQRGFEIAKALARGCEKAGAEILLGTRAFGYFGEEGILGAADETTLYKVRPRRIVIATGSRERNLVYENSDLPGNLLSSAAQSLLNGFAMKPGNEVVMVTNNNYAMRVAAQLASAGVTIKGILDTRKDSYNAECSALTPGDQIETYASCTNVRARGRKWVDGVTAMAGTDHKSVHFCCDTICQSGGFVPRNELIFQATYGGEYLLETSAKILEIKHKPDMSISDSVYVAGDAARVGDFAKSTLEGEIAGRAAAMSVGTGDNDNREKLDDLIGQLSDG